MVRKLKRHRGHKHPVKELTDDQEFELMKMVLDKFLWLGMALVGIGLYLQIARSDLFEGIPYILAGLGVMIVFGIVIVRYFENFTS